MAQLSFDAKISKSADEVWKVVGDFGGLTNYFPGIDACEVDGDVRTLTAMGATIKEQQVSRDDAERTLAYSIIDGPFQGLTHHKATMRVVEDGDGCVFAFEVEVEPDDLAPIFEGIYSNAVNGAKEKLEAE